MKEHEVIVVINRLSKAKQHIIGIAPAFKWSVSCDDMGNVYLQDQLSDKRVSINPAGHWKYYIESAGCYAAAGNSNTKLQYIIYKKPE